MTGGTKHLPGRRKATALPRPYSAHHQLEVLVKAKLDVQRRKPPDPVDAFDVRHREILGQLGALTRLVDRLQAADPDDEARGCARTLIAFFAGPAREHNYDEERHVFPVLQRCDDADVRQAAERLCEDHAWIELCWLDIEPQLAAVAAGAATRDGRGLQSAVEVFASMVRNHIALEESLLYPQLRGRLKSTVVRSINRQMAARSVRDVDASPPMPRAADRGAAGRRSRQGLPAAPSSPARATLRRRTP
jgi:iron-sulfur cluster repair protein YtfE (RIC family)